VYVYGPDGKGDREDYHVTTRVRSAAAYMQQAQPNQGAYSNTNMTLTLLGCDAVVQGCGVSIKMFGK
jgi:hypothetical protein